MEIYEEQSKEIEKELKTGEIGIEKIPALIKRCPKCKSLSLEFDPKTGRIRCTKCGFEESLPMTK